MTQVRKNIDKFQGNGQKVNKLTSWEGKVTSHTVGCPSPTHMAGFYLELEKHA